MEQENIRMATTKRPRKRFVEIRLKGNGGKKLKKWRVKLDRFGEPTLQAAMNRYLYKEKTHSNFSQRE